MLVGYFEHLGSDRSTISTCSLRLDILFLIDYNIDKSLPWHKALSFTRQLYEKEIFKDLFKKFLQGWIDKGLVSGRQEAVDRALIKISTAMDSNLEKEVLEPVDSYSEKLKTNEETASGQRGIGTWNPVQFSGDETFEHRGNEFFIFYASNPAEERNEKQRGMRK